MEGPSAPEDPRVGVTAQQIPSEQSKDAAFSDKQSQLSSIRDVLHQQPSADNKRFLNGFNWVKTNPEAPELVETFTSFTSGFLCDCSNQLNFPPPTTEQVELLFWSTLRDGTMAFLPVIVLSAHSLMFVFLHHNICRHLRPPAVVFHHSSVRYPVCSTRLHRPLQTQLLQDFTGAAGPAEDQQVCRPVLELVWSSHMCVNTRLKGKNISKTLRGATVAALQTWKLLRDAM